jgi:hypothetical protein
MTTDALVQLGAVLLGGILAILGGVWTSNIRLRQEHRRDSRTLALAFKGEIRAFVELVEERSYISRFGEIIEQIEATRQPFFMPFRVRYKYDRVYDANLARIGILKAPLPEKIPLFYTRLASLLEDLVSIGDGTYGNVDLALLLRIYRDTQRILQLTLREGEEIIATIEKAYPET